MDNINFSQWDSEIWAVKFEKIHHRLIDEADGILTLFLPCCWKGKVWQNNSPHNSDDVVFWNLVTSIARSTLCHKFWGVQPTAKKETSPPSDHTEILSFARVWNDWECIFPSTQTNISSRYRVNIPPCPNARFDLLSTYNPGDLTNGYPKRWILYIYIYIIYIKYLWAWTMAILGVSTLNFGTFSWVPAATFKDLFPPSRIPALWDFLHQNLTPPKTNMEVPKLMICH